MTYEDNAVKDLRIAYIGGGSRGWAWTFMRDLALEPALGGTIVLYDIDKEAAKANEIIGNGISERPEAVGKWKYIVADTSEYSFSYIASWSSGKNMKELRASMDTIRKTSADMIGQIEEKLKELQIERAEQEVQMEGRSV